MTQTWMISGVSSGIGRILAEKLTARGDSVVALTRDPRKTEDLQQRYPEQFRPLQVDLRDTRGISAAVAEAFRLSGRIDRIVSNAGYGVFGAAEETSDQHLRDIIDTNLIGAIVLIRAALPYLRAQGGGRILQVSSEGGQIAYPGFSLYHASKWGIEGFVESVAQEVRTFGIDFVLVEPGPTRTGFGGSLVRPASLAEYADTPAAQLRQAFEEGSWVIKGDPVRMADAMLDAAGQPSPPLRLILGAEAHAGVSRALESRLAELRNQQQSATAADFSPEELALY
ncbi:SDR family oxidoreductase [Enterobacteriaceae bacterium BIT-l23]|uniref:SDR family oxidoreductase n=1 Tax=Jejubacter calystegiae TaxID=2579935 RepID=A0A4P8YNH0_9ENTR|nr:SDR family oxidoreductase [Jejubacter calystegiae]NUU67967.1 SDR family oxidoreductase [Enterobacteriaceae bacterium BIT-l23]QCT21284.1 SDR family oxidoreductase [Jejubacter calystegiae]